MNIIKEAKKASVHLAYLTIMKDKAKREVIGHVKFCDTCPVRIACDYTMDWSLYKSCDKKDKAVFKIVGMGDKDKCILWSRE